MQTDVVDGALIKELSRDHLLDDLAQDLFPEVLRRNRVGMLSRNDDGVDTERNGGTTVLLVLNGDLSLGVRAQPRKST